MNTSHNLNTMIKYAALTLLPILSFSASSAESWASQTVSDVDVRLGAGIYHPTNQDSAYAIEFGADFNDFVGFKLQHQTDGSSTDNIEDLSILRFGIEVGYNYHANEYFAIKPFIEFGSAYYNYKELVCSDDQCYKEKQREVGQYYGLGVRANFKYAYLEVNYKFDNMEVKNESNMGVMLGVSYHF